MIEKKEDSFLVMKNIISKEKKIVEELTSLMHSGIKTNIGAVIAHADSLKQQLSIQNNNFSDTLGKIELTRPLNSNGPAEKATNEQEVRKPKENFMQRFEETARLVREYRISRTEKKIVSRLEQKKKDTAKQKEKMKKPHVYAGLASRLFSDIARPLVGSKSFQTMIDDLLKTNLGFIPSAYISIILLSTVLSIGIALFIFIFLLFFNIISTPPFIVPVSDIISRFLEIFWILFVLPLITFIFLYFYPTMEKKSLESKIDQELPFATINMSAVAGSRIEPTNIFNIIISTGEYPSLKTQFTKVMNEINIYGHDLVTALRNAADNCPSKKLADLYNSLATNITSGGDLGEFFEKRSESLLLDYRLERERSTRASETFIDVYISIVIAAPMILMLLLMMIQVSGLGISLSPSTISLMMVLGVAGINFVFLMFLQLKQPGK